MHDPIDPDEFAATLQRELASASELGARGLHVQVTVPREAAYQWVDVDGIAHEVHLPTRIKASPMRYPGEPQEDGGPAAVFHIDAHGQVPPEDVTRQMSSALYRECIRWGRVHHAGWDSPSPDDLPRLPDDYDEIVQTAIFMDVS